MNISSLRSAIPPSPLATPNLLVMSSSATFRHQLQVTASTAMLQRGGKIMVVACHTSPRESLRHWRTAFPQHQVWAVDDLEAWITPTNKPHLAFEHAEVVIVTPAYLQRQLTTPYHLLWDTLYQRNILRSIQLIIVDGLDECPTLAAQGMVELALQRFCLQPLDGQPRQMVVTLAKPITNGATLAT